MKIMAIIQQRMGSTRLPGKALLPLAGKPMTQNILERVQRATRLDDVVLAVPRCDAPHFEAMGYPIHYYDRDPTDLVGRYLACAEAVAADLIVRIPGDNPCVDPLYIDQAVECYMARPQVYVSTMYVPWSDRTYLDGVGAEVFSLSRLHWLDQATRGCPQYREHPHLLFQDQRLIEGWEQYQHYADVSKTIRLDVNTQADYEFIKDIYEHFGHNRFTVPDIMSYLQTKEVPA